MSITVYLYDADGSDREVELSPSLLHELHERRLLWIDIIGRDKEQFEPLAALLRLHADSVRAVLGSPGRPRLYNYGHYFQFGVLALSANSPSTPIPLDILAGSGYVITVHDEAVSFLQEFKKRDKAETEIGLLDSGAMVAVMLDWHLSSFFRVLDSLDVKTDKLDEKLLTRRVEHEFLDELIDLRRQVSRLRRLLFPQRRIFAGLTRPDFALLIKPEEVNHFQAVNERFERATDAIQASSDLIHGSFELFTSRAAEAANESIKTLTFITFVLGVLGVVAGIFGINIDLEFYQLGWVALGEIVAGMIFVSIGVTFYGKYKGWI